MADFGGWDMPIEYPADSGGGVLSEHQAVRERVGVFDVSHLGKVEVRGPGALQFLNQVLTNDLERIIDGQAQYNLLCDSRSGGVVDDLIVYRRSVEEFLLVPNAANAEEVVHRMISNKPAGIEITDCHEAFGVIAIQGPQASEVLRKLGLNLELDYMAFTTGRIGGYEITICRTGYTGEIGYELLPRWDQSLPIWSAITSEVLSAGGLVAGLGARDTLRTEMGYPLHGHELSLDITPVQAGLNWAVGWKKDYFWGKELLEAERSTGPKQILRGLRLLDRGIPRAEMKVYQSDDEIGFLTSGTFSPSLKVGIALGFFQPTLDIGSRVEVDIRGKRVPAELIKPPFLPPHVR
jgi:aminomethyltransferase